MVWMVYKVFLSSWTAKLQFFLLSQCQIFEGRIQEEHRYIVQKSIDFTFHWYDVVIFPVVFEQLNLKYSPRKCGEDSEVWRF